MSQFKKSGRESRFPLLHIFIPFRPSTDQIMPTTLGMAICFISLLIQMLISSKNIFIDIPRITFNQIGWHPVVQSRVLCAQLCPALCSPMDCGPPGSSVHGIFQVRILEWGAISYSRRSPRPRDQTCSFCVSCIGRRILYHQLHLAC